MEGTLDKTPQGLAFTSIAIAVDLVAAEEDPARAGDLLRTAKDHCIAANALKTPVLLTATVRTEALAPA